MAPLYDPLKEDAQNAKFVSTSLSSPIFRVSTRLFGYERTRQLPSVNYKVSDSVMLTNGREPARDDLQNQTIYSSSGRVNRSPKKLA